eukprot:scaffold29814_cov112-Isochrysis_galbana.AAC.1
MLVYTHIEVEESPDSEDAGKVERAQRIRRISIGAMKIECRTILSHTARAADRRDQKGSWDRTCRRAG